jgi:VWFA-related protein
MRIYGKAKIASVLALAALAVRAQAPEPAASGTTIRTETRLVLVDAVVTDKKGAYVHDLTAKDFKVWEDNKEQKIKSFTFESGPDPASSGGRPHYLVLFFDNSTMSLGDQGRARDAAAKFVEKNAGADRYMAVVNFTGAMRIAQNFTNDAARLQAAVKNVKVTNVVSDAGAPVGDGQVSPLEAGFGARNAILAIRNLAKGLSAVPGRKTLVLFTNGFPVSAEQMADITTTIDICNKSNVAVYPIDVRGLVTGVPAAGLIAPAFPTAGLLASNGHWFLDAFALNAAFRSGSMAFLAQARGGGGAGGGGASGGGRGGVTGGTSGGAIVGGTAPGSGGIRGLGGSTAGGSIPQNNSNGLPPGFSRPGGGGTIVPQIPESTETNQQMMFLLAQGTGGFVIRNTNDLLAGLTKIGQEQNEYYILGYTPPEEEERVCHALRVKVERAGVDVRARTGYCSSKPLDVLAGNKTEKDLEAHAAGAPEAAPRASMRLPYFYTASNVARVNVAIEVAPGTVKFEKLKGKFHAQFNLVGLAYAADGAVAARFSDGLKLDLEDKKQVDATQQKVLHYENQFEIAPGQYTLKVAYSSDGVSYGKLEMPLTIDPYQEGQFGISGLALSKEIRNAAQGGANLDALLLEDKVPLVAKGFQIVPTGDRAFKKTDPASMYFEVYEPLIATPDPQKATEVAMQLRILDRKTGEMKQDTGLLAMDLPATGGSPVLSAGIRVPIDALPAGPYTLEIKAQDSAGRSATRSTEIDIE